MVISNIPFSEDFGRANALRILEKFRPRFSCFNDDIQGTGIVALAAVLAGLHVSHIRQEDARIVVFGAGSAGIGVSSRIAANIAVQANKPIQEARKQIWYVSHPKFLLLSLSLSSILIFYRCLDKQGLLLKSQGDQLTEGQAPFAREDNEWPNNAGTDLLSVVKIVKPHVLLGLSTRGGSFTEEIVREVSRHVETPIIMPLSNPSRLHEAEPKDINVWSDERALIATGSPFPPLERHGRKYEIGELGLKSFRFSLLRLTSAMQPSVTIQHPSPELVLG